MKKEYMSPSVSVEMYDLETTVLDGSWTNKDPNEPEEGDDGDRAQAPHRPRPGLGNSGDKGWGSLW